MALRARQRPVAGAERGQPAAEQPPAEQPPAEQPAARIADAAGFPGGPTGAAGGPPGSGVMVGDAFNFGWQKFQQNMGPILLGTLIYLAASAVIGILWFFVAGAIIGVGGDSGAGFFAFLLTSAVMGVVFVALFFVIQAGITRAALRITDGQPVDLSTLLSLDDIGQVVIASLLVGLASAIGFVLCYVPGLVVMVFTGFTMQFVIDKRMSATDAIRASVELVNRNLGTMVLLLVAGYVANAIGSALCGIGLLVSMPVVILANTYAYRRMLGEPVAA